jgi:hypothetical protein
LDADREMLCENRQGLFCASLLQVAGYREDDFGHRHSSRWIDGQLGRDQQRIARLVGLNV